VLLASAVGAAVIRYHDLETVAREVHRRKRVEARRELLRTRVRRDHDGEEWLLGHLSALVNVVADIMDLPVLIRPALEMASRCALSSMCANRIVVPALESGAPHYNGDVV